MAGKSTKKAEQERLYKNLAEIRFLIDGALTQIGQVDTSENLAEAAFKAGRAYGPLDRANDKLQEILDEMYELNNFNHWDDILDEN